jgi:AcrR family transcriptional regulator
MKKRFTPDERRKKIIDAAFNLSVATNYLTITRDEVATAANCAPTLVNHYFGTIADLRQVVLDKALATENSMILAQAIVSGSITVDNELFDRVMSGVTYAKGA